ncbi:MAG TPA: DMT family transporter [Candidatus Acidoferrum sp.]|nr:DMT family transporter [Candidatus Acidoferrum sp.]
MGTLAVLVASACFGTLGPVSRLAYQGGLEPLGFVAWRSGIGGLILAAYLAIRVSRGGERWVPFRSMPRRTVVSLCVVTTSAVLLNLSLFTAFGRVTVALALLGFYTYPVLLALFEAVIRRRSPGRPTLLALALAVGGMVLVVAGGLGSAGALQVDLLGLGLAFFAACSQTVFISVSRDGYGGVPVLQAMTIILVGAAVGFVVIAFAIGGGGQLAGPLEHPETIGLLFVGGAIGAGLASALFLAGIRTIGGLRTGILALFEPVVGVALAAVLLAEVVAPIQVLGGGLVLGAAVLLQLVAPNRGDSSAVPPEAVPGTV